MKDKISKRCKWAKDELMIEYHDNEWGLPAHDDSTLLEFIILESAQAGLSWSTILKKRKGYQEAFRNFDASKIATFKDADIQLLMKPMKTTTKQGRGFLTGNFVKPVVQKIAANAVDVIFADMASCEPSVNGENMPMLKQHLWSSMAVLPYLPALTVPIGQTEAGLPVGINWLGPVFSDLQLTGMAAAVMAQL